MQKSNAQLSQKSQHIELHQDCFPHTRGRTIFYGPTDGNTTGYIPNGFLVHSDTYHTYIQQPGSQEQCKVPEYTTKSNQNEIEIHRQLSPTDREHRKVNTK